MTLYGFKQLLKNSLNVIIGHFSGLLLFNEVSYQHYHINLRTIIIKNFENFRQRFNVFRL